MSADLRRFEYPLEPLRRQRRWQLDALQAKLGKAQRALTEAEVLVDSLRDRLERDAARAAKLLVERVEPSCHRHAIAFLVELRDRIRAGADEASRLRGERDRVRAECLAQQQRLEVIERHRDECVAEFQRDEEARLASDADRDWLSRQQWSAKRVEGQP